MINFSAQTVAEVGPPSTGTVGPFLILMGNFILYFRFRCLFPDRKVGCPLRVRGPIRVAHTNFKSKFDGPEFDLKFVWATLFGSPTLNGRPTFLEL